MNSTEVDEFIEKHCGVDIYPWQREILRQVLAMDETKVVQIEIMPSRSYGRTTLQDWLKDYYAEQGKIPVCRAPRPNGYCRGPEL